MGQMGFCFLLPGRANEDGSKQNKGKPAPGVERVGQPGANNLDVSYLARSLVTSAA